MLDITNLQSLVIPFLVTLFFFYIEACIHFNMGKYGKLGCKIPPFRENIQIIGIISFFSSLSISATYLLKIYFTK